MVRRIDNSYAQRGEGDGETVASFKWFRSHVEKNMSFFGITFDHAFVMCGGNGRLTNVTLGSEIIWFKTAQ